MAYILEFAKVAESAGLGKDDESSEGSTYMYINFLTRNTYSKQSHLLTTKLTNYGYYYLRVLFSSTITFLIVYLVCVLTNFLNKYYNRCKNAVSGHCNIARIAILLTTTSMYS